MLNTGGSKRNWAGVLTNSKIQVWRSGRRTKDLMFVCLIGRASKHGMGDAEESKLTWIETTTFAGKASRECDGTVEVFSIACATGLPGKGGAHETKTETHAARRPLCRAHVFRKTSRSTLQEIG